LTRVVDDAAQSDDSPKNQLIGPLQRYLSKQAGNKIATLGPDGTSSAAAANYLVRDIADIGVELFASYELAAASVVDGSTDFLIVANAYAEINRFYISADLVPVGAFPMATPPYGIATDRGCVRDLKSGLLATHPAPMHLAQNWMDEIGASLEIVLAPSTSAAAEMVRSGRAAACITNDNARMAAKLDFVSSVRPIRMIWTVFASEQSPTSRFLF
jgi:ABC-type amino acid transport substrate-binding protein